LYDKSEEDVSPAGEQLTSNKIYDGENHHCKAFPKERLLLFGVFIVNMASKNSYFRYYHNFNERKIYKNNLLSTEPFQ